MRNLLVLVFLAMLGLGSTAATAQSPAYPSRPVKLIVPFPAAGTSDLIARAIAQKLSEAWGQSVIVENHGGAGGNIGMGIAARAPADGYTLLMVSAVYVVNPSLYPNVPYDPLKSFIAVSNVATSPDVFIVNPSVHANSMKELAALMRANAKSFGIATPGVGTTTDLSAELFRRASKADVVRVPYSGAGPALTAVLGNQVSVGCLALPGVMSSIKSGAVHALAVTSRKRSAVLPDVPTMAEAGFGAHISEGFQGIFAPAGTPDAIVAKISAAVAKIIAMPDIQARLQGFGYDTVGSTPEQFAKEIGEELAKWHDVIETAKIKIQ